MEAVSMKKPRAFVIMPFDEGFNDIYAQFIAETLIGCGYEVTRADNIQSSRNILRDILTGIRQADLVIADLTDANPNVFYELGLAHALTTPVVLLTQNIDEIPFDLQGYRVIPYQTHFTSVAKARRQLETLAKGLLDGTLEYGSPVSDFLGIPVKKYSQSAEPVQSEEAAGFLDYMADLEGGFESLGNIAQQCGEKLGVLTGHMGQVTERIEQVTSHPDGTSARQLRALAMGMASHMSEYARFLSGANDAYSEALGRTREALESIVRIHDVTKEEDRARLKGFIDHLHSLEETVSGSLTAVHSLTETIRSQPSAERTLNRATKAVVNEQGRYAENIEQTLSMINRTRQIGESRLQ